MEFRKHYSEFSFIQDFFRGACLFSNRTVTTFRLMQVTRFCLKSVVSSPLNKITCTIIPLLPWQQNAHRFHFYHERARYWEFLRLALCTQEGNNDHHNDSNDNEQNTNNSVRSRQDSRNTVCVALCSPTGLAVGSFDYTKTLAIWLSRRSLNSISCYICNYAFRHFHKVTTKYILITLIKNR